MLKDYADVQMELYLGKEGLSSKSPFRNRATSGYAPKVML